MAFSNKFIDPYLQSLGIMALVELNYDEALSIPQFNAAIRDPTNQTVSTLVVQNSSTAFKAEFVISPSPDDSDGIYTIKPNGAQRVFQKNWNGAALKISNISQEAATIKVFLT